MLLNSFLLAELFIISILHYRSSNGLESYNCDSAMFQCLDQQCIPNQWLCDHEDDCKDGSDEDGCEHDCDWANEFRCSTGSAECMPLIWQCDGEFDCTDKSDELKCNGTSSGKACSADEFSCHADGRGGCISNLLMCDGHADCQSGLDEDNVTCMLHQCNNETEYKCKSDGRCISLRWICDRDSDCLDGSDELNCPTIEACEKDEFKCDSKLGTGRCIPQRWVCDNTLDCRDKSDENNANCTHVSPRNSTGQACREEEFQCRLSGDCIHKAWKCDNDLDCDDGSDEDNCVDKSCIDHDHKQCDSGLCILSSLWCDGVDHCNDGSDEANCNPECDMLKEFDCSDSHKHACINISKVCNGKDDCPNRKDENHDLCELDHSKSCEANNGRGMCAQLCFANRIDQFCGCNPGFQLENDNTSCIDINECKLPGYCSQMCSNLVGSYKCACHPGYILDPHDHTTCRLNGSEPVLMFSNRHDLRQIGLYSNHYKSILSNTRNIIAIDFDVKERFLYLSDITLENITRLKLNIDDQPTSPEVLAKEDIGIPDGLAYDWIHSNIYWTDTGKDRIEVMSMTGGGRHRQTLISTGLDEPRAIVVEPRKNHRYIFWTDWGSKPKIERARLDGSQRIEIINTDVTWPNGLTIDYTTHRLYWVDAKRHVIESADFNGQQRHVVLQSIQHLAHPFAISVFENEIFWTDWSTHSILRLSRKKHASDAVSTLIHDLMSPMDIHIYHARTQQHERNICDNSKCSHICLPNGHLETYTCLCPRDTTHDRYQMGSDGFTCDMSKKTGEESSEGSQTHAPSVVSHSQQMNNSYSVPIIITLSVVLFVIVAILLLLIVRRLYLKRNIKTFNFDNPVYRRTTSESHVPFKYGENQDTIASIHNTTALQPLNNNCNEIV